MTLIFALQAQMARIEAEGVERRLERHLAMARRCWEWTDSIGSSRGLSAFAPVGYRSPTVTAIAVPDRLPGSAIAARLKERGYTIAPGYGKLKDATIRIGHMGDHTTEGLNRLLEELEEIVRG